MVPTRPALSSKSKAARRAARWLSLSPGAPRVLPMRWDVITTRGSVMASIRYRKARIAMITVGIPASSNNLAMCPTDTWHTGQTGTNNTASIFCCWNILTHRGPVCFNRGVCAQAPTNE